MKGNTKAFVVTALAAAVGVTLAGFAMYQFRDVDLIDKARRGFDV